MRSEKATLCTEPSCFSNYGLKGLGLGLRVVWLSQGPRWRRNGQEGSVREGLLKAYLRLRVLESLGLQRSPEAAPCMGKQS